ncbi:MAG: formate dehydrogenase subunit gamma [Vicinamibacterales bacterium]
MPDARAERFILRFDRFHRLTHICLMTSFLGLAATGMPLLFASEPWAPLLSRAFGGFQRAGAFHRVFAVLMIGTFLAHVGRVVYRVYVRKELNLLWGPDSMVPQPRDVVEMYQHFRWFVGRGARPRFGHFTYWEKFDYWAVFWGMLIIGGSGLLLWFPTFFSLALPGWVFNVAFLIHGEEALLAVGFIFTIHFFNGHLRPEKFPMDLVIFTGRVSEHDLADERRGEMESLRRSGRLMRVQAGPPSPRSVLIGRIVGTAAVATGLLIVGLIVYAVVL